MADRQMPHRIAAVGLEAEAFGDLTRQEIAHHIFAAGRNRDAARLERRQPVGVDVGEHARGGAELQKRDILALGDRAGKLRLHLDDIGFGEPADQIDIVHGQIDDDADIGHPRRKRPDAGDADGQNILARDRLLDRGDRRIEALDMADHQRHAGTARRVDDVLPLLHRRGDRLLDQDVDVARDAGERNFMMEMGRRRDRDGVDALVKQFVEFGERAAADERDGPRAVFRQRIDDADQRHPGQTGQHPGMVAAHHARADHADAQAAYCIGLRARCGPFGIHDFVDPKTDFEKILRR